ncbi:beta-mannosidase [Sporobolomyces salmoneus]|uniref:beta-mannosidase n=1 Tax=Sporobolomyces salmoneus TaxID=183962 RepID=UPI00316D2F30
MRTLDLNVTTAQWSWSKVPPHSTSESDPAELSSLSTYRPCSQFPSQVHVELMKVKEIPDPFLKRNEELVQWVGEEDWVYKCDFSLDKLPREGEQSDLVFEGLDTFATVFLNGRKVLEADNMFTPYRIQVTSNLQYYNTLYIVFHSAFRRGRQIEEEKLGRGNHPPAWNGDPSRLFVRKAGYNYGWDWGPVLMTAGPWRPIRLETYTSRIYDFWPQAIVDSDLNPFLRVRYKVADAAPDQSLNVTVSDPAGVVVSKVSLNADDSEVMIKSLADEREVELWYPSGMGQQPLYSIELSLIDEKTGAVIDQAKRKVGFRRLEVVQEPLVDAPGTSFCFRVNSIPFFAGGSNWIPIDSFLSNATEERYRKWLELLVEGNQNIIRVWGGGVYEDEKFYEICDALGILVWQDFMFACGAYPADPPFLESVRREAIANVKRLRHHACLALLAGNNEDYQVAESEKLEYDPDDHDGDWSKTNFPAREIYERLLPSIVAENSNTFYWPGSPFGGSSTRDPTVGDIHQWDVWHGSQAPYQDYDKLSGRFVSEFGMEGAPDMRTIEYFLDGDKSEAYPESRTMDAHNKAGGQARRLASCIAENLRSSDNSLDSYIYATQFIQAEALSTAFSSWRRLFKGGIEQAYCSGALVWQLNDVWPTTSWSIVDYFLRPKPSFYTIKRALAPIALGSKRYTKRTFPDPYSASKSTDHTFVDFWVSNSRLESFDAKLVVEGFELKSGKKVLSKDKDVDIPFNRATELHKIELAQEEGKVNDIVISAKLFDKQGNLVSRTFAWPEPFKYLEFANEETIDLKVELSITDQTVTLEAARPVKGIVLRANDECSLTDNFIDLVPGQEITIGIRGATEQTKLSWTHCGSFAE